jgi:hypothetical protein
MIMTKEKLIELAMEADSCKTTLETLKARQTPADVHERVQQDVEYQLASKLLYRARWEYNIALDKYLDNS